MAACSISPSSYVGGVCQRSSLMSSPSRSSRRSASGSRLRSRSPSRSTSKTSSVTGLVFGQRRGPTGVADVHPVGQPAERGDAVAERHHLRVQQHVAHRQRLELREGDGHVVLVARGQPDAVPGLDQDPHPVPLHLVRPLPTGGYVGATGGQHGTHGDILTDTVARASETVPGKEEHASDLEGCGVLRTGQRAREAVLRDRVPRRVLPPGARQGRRPDQVPARLLDRRRGDRVRRHRQGLRDRGRRDGHPRPTRTWPTCRSRPAARSRSRSSSRPTRSTRCCSRSPTTSSPRRPAPSRTPSSARRCSTPTGWPSSPSPCASAPPSPCSACATT